MAEQIERPLWNVLCPSGDPIETTVTARPTVVEIESDDGRVQINVYAQEDGIDIRVHDLQVTVKGKRVTVMQQHPPYPIERWTLHWEGVLS
jgi:hypothetical protein